MQRFIIRYCFTNQAPLKFAHLNYTLSSLQQVKNVHPIKLDKEEVKYLQELHELEDWSLNPQITSIHRSIRFKNFIESMAFMNTIAIIAEEMNHHPDWKNVYNVVDITLNTHDADGISIKDFILAHAIDQVAMEIQIKSAKDLDDISALDLMKIALSWNYRLTQQKN